MLFDKQIILLQKDKVDTKESALKVLGNHFQTEGLVTDQFIESVMTREEHFPTGLYVNHIGIAIPHTDSDKVKQSQIGFMSLKKPVHFKAMDGSKELVPVQLIFMLALKEPAEQLDILRKLMDVFQKKEVLTAMLACSNIEDYLSIIRDQKLI